MTVKLRSSDRWTPAEDELLRASYPDGGVRAALLVLPGRSRCAIIIRANRHLGLTSLRRKLTDIERASLRRRFAAGEKQAALAAEYGIGDTWAVMICRAARRRPARGSPACSAACLVAETSRLYGVTAEQLRTTPPRGMPSGPLPHARAVLAQAMRLAGFRAETAGLALASDVQSVKHLWWLARRQQLLHVAETVAARACAAKQMEERTG